MPHVVAHHDKPPKNKRNPKPSPIGNNFGFLSFLAPPAQLEPNDPFATLTHNFAYAKLPQPLRGVVLAVNPNKAKQKTASV